MALEASDQVAVLAAVAGGLPASLRDRVPAHAVSAMLIHGTADTLSPIAGGYSRHRGPHGELRGRTLSLEDPAGGCAPPPANCSRNPCRVRLFLPWAPVGHVAFDVLWCALGLVRDGGG
jgi:hypothetical protein